MVLSGGSLQIHVSPKAYRRLPTHRCQPDCFDAEKMPTSLQLPARASLVMPRTDSPRANALWLDKSAADHQITCSPNPCWTTSTAAPSAVGLVLLLLRE